jgi:hypothetical protein
MKTTGFSNLAGEKRDMSLRDSARKRERDSECVRKSERALERERDLGRDTGDSAKGAYDKYQAESSAHSRHPSLSLTFFFLSLSVAMRSIE